MFAYVLYYRTQNIDKKNNRLIDNNTAVHIYGTKT